MGEEVSSAALSILNENRFDPALNYTYIAVIPKVHSPKQVAKFKFISLCNVIYKIVTKVLANKFKGILPKIILPNQNAFIPDRLITDNIMVTYEVFHTMKTRQKDPKEIWL